MRKKSKTAFSLIELSILITVISVIIAGILSVTISKAVTQKGQSTNDNIAEIYQALGQYLLSHKRLPCPAPITDIKSSTSTYATSSVAIDCVDSGIYQSSSSTNLVYGMVPTKTLGLDENIAEDAHGNKIVYVVDKRLTTTSDDSFENNIANSAIIQISNTTITNALFVLISRGPNQSAAYNVNSASASASIGDESSNDLSSVNNSSSPPTSDFDDTFLAASTSADFDDVVFYKTQSELFDDFDAWHLVPCSSASSTETLYCGTSITWPKAYANQVVSATTACPDGWQAGLTNPTKKCGAKGVWGSVVTGCTSESAANTACHVGYCTKKCNYGSNAHDPNFDSGVAAEEVPSGTVITLRCDSGSGHNYISQGTYSRTYSPGEEDLCNIESDGTYKFTTTDRTSSAPTVTCNNGTWDSVTNPCQTCRTCSSTLNAQTTVTLQDEALGDNTTCYGRYQSLSAFPADYDCYGLNGVSNCTGGNIHLLTPSSIGHLSEQTVCQYQSHGDQSSATINVKCLDGRYYGLIACSGDDTMGGGHNGSWSASCSYNSQYFSFSSLVNSDDSSICGSGSCTKMQHHAKGHAYDSAYSAGTTASGETVNLRCDSGYGHILSSSRTITANEPDICNAEIDGINKFTTTDRSASAPSVTCTDGAWDSVTNPCSICRSCSSVAGAQSSITSTNASPESTNYCFGEYRTGSGVDNYDCYGISGSTCQVLSSGVSKSQHLFTPRGSGHLSDQNWCQYQKHGDDSSANFTFKCVDGRFYGLLYCNSGSTAGNNHNDYWASSCSSNQQNFGSVINAY